MILHVARKVQKLRKGYEGKIAVDIFYRFCG